MNTLLSHEQLNQQDLALSSQGHSVLRPSLGLIVVGFLIAGMLYATASVSIAQLIFPKQANGSVIELNGKIIGSSLVGQNFVSEQYFHGRPSAVSYNVDGMAGSNLAISNLDLQKQIKERTVQFAQNNHITEQHVRDLVQQQIQPAQFGVYGQARVNVLQLNLALDQLSSTTR